MSILEQNTLALQTVLEKVNNLPDAGITLPELGDTAAQPGDMAANKVLYDDEGNPVIGTVKECTNVYTTPNPSKAKIEWDDDWRAYNTLEEDVLLRKGTEVEMWFARGYFGEATAADVAKGKTFTSGSGICIEGTHECETVPEPKTCTITFNILQDGTSALNYITESVPVFAYTGSDGEPKPASGFVVTKTSKIGAIEGYYHLECLCASMLSVRNDFHNTVKVTYDKEITVVDAGMFLLKTPSEPGNYVINWTLSSEKSWEAI